MAALRCAWRSTTTTISSVRGATALRHGAVATTQRGALGRRLADAPMLSCGVHRAAAKFQPTNVPISDAERKLLEKLGEPDQEIRGYLNELYDDFDVGTEKRREQRLKKKRNTKDDKKEEEETPPSTSSAPHSTTTTTTAASGGIALMSARSFHSSAAVHRNADDETPADNADGQLKPSMREKQGVFTDESQIIWDSQEKDDLSSHVQLEYYPENQKVDSLQGVTLTRGVEGVFDVDELVELLREERLQDIACIELPRELPYADYFVVCTAMSGRQSKAITQFLKKMFKRKKNSDDTPLKIEGLECDEWRCLDMGNIVLHIFDQETREMYDLETLWTVGSDMDDLACGFAQSEDVDSLQAHMDFVRNLVNENAARASS